MHVVVIGAGIVGVSAGIWLRRLGVEATLVDRAAPGEGTSHGNAGVLASCSMVPVTGPGLVRKAPGMLRNPDYPLFLRWSYLPRLLPWLRRYLGHANDADTRRIAAGLVEIVGDSVEQHMALAKGTPAEAFIVPSEYSFAYSDRAAFEADAYVWDIRRSHGFEPVIREGEAARSHMPELGPEVGLLATMTDHGHVRSPGGYVKALAEEFVRLGGTLRRAELTGFDRDGDALRAVETTDGPIPCEACVVATGVWSRPLMAMLGLSVPLETERGYHIVFENARGGPTHPVMVASGKFVATPMEQGLRCAGIVEFGGLEAGPSQAPLDLLRRQVRRAFPGLEHDGEVTWLGHRPAPSDSLPVIGEVSPGAFAAFGHHHIGLTGGPKTGRLVAQLVAGQRPNIDLAPYAPARFA